MRVEPCVRYPGYFHAKRDGERRNEVGPLTVWGIVGDGAAQITYAYHTPWTPAAGIFYAWGPFPPAYGNLLCVGGKGVGHSGRDYSCVGPTRYGPAGIPITHPSPERLKYLLRRHTRVSVWWRLYPLYFLMNTASTRAQRLNDSCMRRAPVREYPPAPSYFSQIITSRIPSVYQ